MKENFTILLVEDDENDVFMIQRAFKKSGISHPIQQVSDGTQAVAYLSGAEPFHRDTHPFPDVIILDLKMPRMGGFELLAWMRDNDEFRIIPTIVMSSSRENRDIEKAYALGANTFMVKPGSPDDLAKMIKSLHDYWTVSTKPQIQPEQKLSAQA